MKNYKIMLTFTLKAPVSHIGEVASTGSYFNMLTTSDGRLPIITGNSIRGALRNDGASYLLDKLGVTVEKEIFHDLFSGGNLNESMHLDIGKAKNVRERLPFVSVFGGALGDMIMAGKLKVGHAYPICSEAGEITGIASSTSWHDLMGEIEFTRVDDAKDDELAYKYCSDPDSEGKGTASQQMRYSVSYVGPGAQFVSEILLEDATDEELGALLSSLKKYIDRGYIGGMSAKGFGKFGADIKVYPEPDGDPIAKYDATITDSTKDDLNLLKAVKAEKGAKKNGAKDKPIENNAEAD